MHGPEHTPPPVRLHRSTLIAGSALVLTTSLGSLGGLVYFIRQDLSRTAADVDRLRSLTVHQADEIARLESRLVTVGEELDDYRALEARARAEVEARLSKTTEASAGEVRQQLIELESRVQALRSAAEEHARALAAARQDGDVEARLRELMGPSVRVNGRHEVGSGTVLWSKPVGDEVHTYVLTAWHVVKEERGSSDGWPLEVDAYEDGVLVRTEPATILAKDERLDLALLRVVGKTPHRSLARLATRSELADVRIFSSVHAIGCPLGYPPLPTSGELTSRGKELDGIHYWMINAPTIFGNSGGGIYAARSRMLVGVLSRISAYKSMIDVAVPHMGLVVPLDQVYDWLDRTPYGFVYRDRLVRTAEAATVPASSRSER